MKDFSYYKPSTVSEAVALLAAHGENRPLSGGMTLLPTMKMRLAAPTAIVDLAGLPGLTAMTVGGGSVTIGAMTTHADVAASAEIKAAIPALATLAGLIGDPQVRHRGTIGGSMANADPSADYPAAAVGLGATIVTDRREIAADSFFTAMFQTALEPDEIILAVRFPIPDAAGYAKFRSQASPRSTVVKDSIWPSAISSKISPVGISLSIQSPPLLIFLIACSSVVKSAPLSK